MIAEINKLKVSKDDRNLVETFMGYADGYLSCWITWNDVMPVVEKIWDITKCRASIFWFQVDVNGFNEYITPTIEHTTNINDCFSSVVEFIKYHNTKQKVKLYGKKI